MARLLRYHPLFDCDVREKELQSMSETDVAVYDDDAELTRYIWNNFRHLLTDKERLVDKAVAAREKADGVSSAAFERLLRTEFGRFDDAEVNSALAEGIQAFRRKVRERILVDPSCEIYINRCMSCSRIVRTPHAEQCLWCGCDWHGRSGERRSDE